MGWYFYVLLFSFNAVCRPLSGFYRSLKGRGPQVENILLWTMDLYFLGSQISFADILSLVCQICCWQLWVLACCQENRVRFDIRIYVLSLSAFYIWPLPEHTAKRWMAVARAHMHHNGLSTKADSCFGNLNCFWRQCFDVQGNVFLSKGQICVWFHHLSPYGEVASGGGS